MAEYIDREVAVKAFNNFDAGRAVSTHSTLLTPEEFAEYLYELPAADVSLVVHARWIGSKYDPETGDYMEKCSHCGVFSREYWKLHCSECGALMDGGNS